MREREWTRLLARVAPVLAIAVTLWFPAQAGRAREQLKVEVLARALFPGEPLRVEVTATKSLETLEGEFLERGITMIRVDRPQNGLRWSGWTMIPLDQKPGPAGISLRGITRSGVRVVGAASVTVAKKTFPEEMLEVAPRFVKPPEEVEARLTTERGQLARIYRNHSPMMPATEPFVRPVPGEPTSEFGTRRIFNGEPRSPHPGIDLRAASGDEVLAAGPGRVALAHDLYYSGNTVILDHGGGLYTLYAHLSKILVQENDHVPAGILLGQVGATGRVTGPHLHWGAKIGDRPFDPRALLAPNLWRVK